MKKKYSIKPEVNDLFFIPFPPARDIFKKSCKEFRGTQRKLFRKVKFPLLSELGNSMEQNQSILAKINLHDGAIRYEVIV